MFSAFQYFEAKELRLASLCYIMTMALMCTLYFIADRPGWHIESKTWHLVQYNYSVSYDLNDDLQTEDIHHQLSSVISNLNMTSVEHKVECDSKNCILTFKPLNKQGRRVAKAAQRQMQSLKH